MCINSIIGILKIVTLSKNSIHIGYRVNAKSSLILTKFSGSLFNSTVSSGHSEEHGQDLGVGVGGALFFGEYVLRGFPKLGSRERIFLEK